MCVCGCVGVWVCGCVGVWVVYRVAASRVASQSVALLVRVCVCPYALCVCVFPLCVRAVLYATCMHFCP